MKKLFCAIALLSVAMSMSVGVLASDVRAKAANATTRPVIDGEIDEIWGSTDKMYGSNYGGETDNERFVNSYASVLWDEKGLYLLGVVYDKTITEDDVDARNSVDFWVSEKYTEGGNYEDDGDWHYCKASDGTEVYYTGNETVYDEAETAYAVYDEYYVIELFVPYQSDIKPQVGTEIGFTVSFNDDFDNDGIRDMYTYWEVTDLADDYWANTEALPRIAFAEGPKVEIPEEPTVSEPAAEPAAEVPAAPVTADPIGAVLAAAAASFTVCMISRRKKK